MSFPVHPQWPLRSKFVTSCFSDKVLSAVVRVSWMKALTEPAKLADGVIAPGDGSAEPGVKVAKSNRACEAGDRWLVTKICKL